MKRQLLILLLLTLGGIGNQLLACKCPTISIDKEADKAYDIVIGRVVSAKPGKLLCPYGADVSFEFEVEYSYKGKLNGRVQLFGGQGGGSCGGILWENYDYLVVVHKCDDGLYTTMCSDNAYLEHASNQINFLNKHFGKNYRISGLNFLIGMILISLLVLAGAGFIAFNYYKKIQTRKNRA